MGAAKYSGYCEEEEEAIGVEAGVVVVVMVIVEGAFRRWLEVRGVKRLDDEDGLMISL